MSKKIFLFVLFFFSFFIQEINAAENKVLTLQRVTPSGQEVTERSQIVFQFDKPMTELGNMDRKASDIPVSIVPEVSCSWRWLNTTALACQLGDKEELMLAERYDITVKPDFVSLDGSKMKNAETYVIKTQRPEILADSTRFYDFVSPQRPRWRVTFAMPVKESSIKGRIMFFAQGRKVPAVVTLQKYWDEVYYYIKPAEDLGRGVPYKIIYEKGFKALNGGSLPSARAGILAAANTLPEFHIKGIRCYDSNDNVKFYSLADIEKEIPVCRYSTYMNVYVVLSGNAVLDKVSKQAKVTSSARITDRPYSSESEIAIVGLQAGKEYTVTVSPEVTDVWGAKLGKETVLSFKVSDREPNLENLYSSAVLEAQENTDLIGYAANLQKAEIEFKAFDYKNTFSGTHQISEIYPKLRNVQYPFDVGVREMMKGRSGFLTGRYITDPFVSTSQGFYVSVSPWETIVKFGHFSSLVWVVDMKTGKEVKNAKVELYKQAIKSPDATPDEILASAKTDKNGIAFLPGYAGFDPNGKVLKNWRENSPVFFIKVTKDKDVAVMPLNETFSVSAGQLSDWNVDTVYDISKPMYVDSWGTTAQGVYRQGENVQYKIYVREANEFSFGKAPQGEYELTVTDPLDKKIFQSDDVVLSDFGALSGEFKLPEKTASGWYTFNLKYNSKEMKPMRFLVSDFVPSPFKVSTETNSKVFQAGENAKISSYATLFSGGAYADAPVRQTVVLSYAPFIYRGKGLDGKEFNFSQPLDDEYDDETLLDQKEKLDIKGEFHNTVALKKSVKPYGKLQIESTVSDDGGRSTSSSVSADYFSVNRLIGLRKKEWSSTVGKPAVFEYVVSNTNHELVAGAPVKIEFIYFDNKIVREKTSGNAYVATYIREEQNVGECSGVSKVSVRKCSFTPKQSGSYKAVASVVDTNGRTHFVEDYFYADGEGYVAWETKNNRLDMTLDKKEYQAGDTVRIMVKNPVPGAQALVTVERYGILKSFVKTFKNSTAFVDIPVTQDFFPGVYVSVTVFSARADKPVEGEVDLGKPAEWGGYVKIPVTDKSKLIQVEASSEKKVYKPREKAKINIQAKLPAGVRQKSKIEAAVVVLDEAVLALLPGGTSAYDPYKGFYSLKNLDVRNYSLIERLVGRQKVDKKGANQGGDGGSDFAMRDIFKFVGYWNPSLVLDSDGKGSFEMELPDNLTGWRVIVMAVNETDLMGMGETRFEVNKPLEIRPLLPNQVRTTDVFAPAVSVLNRSKTEQAVTVAVSAQGNVAQPASFTKKIVLKPFERGSVFFDEITAVLNPEKASGEITLRFTAKAGNETDGLVQTVPVLNLTTMQTAAEYGSTTGEKVELPLLVPQDVSTYGGSLVMAVSPTALGGLDKVVEYMEKYPYSCWEQQISRAVVAATYLKVKENLSSRDLWPQADEFVRETLEKASAYQASNGGIAYFEAQNDYVSPYLSAYTSYALVQLKQMGYAIPADVEKGLQQYLYRIFRETDSSIGPEVLKTTRLMSLPFLMSSGQERIVPCDMDIFERDLPMMSVFDKALFLNAARSVPGQEALAGRVQESLMSMMNVTAGNVLFQNGKTGPWWYALLSSPARDNCAVLTAMTAAGVPDKDGDIPEKLFHAVSGLRRADGTWQNTQANVFCMTAAQSYAQTYESQPVNMTVAGRMDDKTVLTADFTSKSSEPVESKTALTANEAGKKLTASFNKEGGGRYYYKTLLSYPAMDGKAVLAGMEVTRSYSVERNGTFVPVTENTLLKRGELVRVVLTVMNPAPRTFVAMMDPVPGGLEPVNRDLATASTFDADKADDDWGTFWSGFYFREIGHDAVKFYAETLEDGTFDLSYVAQVVADGTFKAFPAKIEAMYEPDIFGLSRLESISVSTGVQQVPEYAESVEEGSSETVPDETVVVEEAEEAVKTPPAASGSLFNRFIKAVKSWTNQTPDDPEEDEQKQMDKEAHPMMENVRDNVSAVQEKPVQENDTAA